MLLLLLLLLLLLPVVWLLPSGSAVAIQRQCGGIGSTAPCNLLQMCQECSQGRVQHLRAANLWARFAACPAR
jgi:hypothetical protein